MVKTDKDIFSAFVGQEGPKRKLNYRYSIWQQGGIFPNLFIVAPKGCGKTAFATQLGESMAKHQQGREFLAETCSGYKNMEVFMNNVIMPKVHGKRVTILLDECHGLPKDVQTAFLTMLAPNKNFVNPSLALLQGVRPADAAGMGRSRRPKRSLWRQRHHVKFRLQAV